KRISALNCRESKDEHQRFLTAFESTFIDQLRHIDLAPVADQSITKQPTSPNKLRSATTKNLYIVATGEMPAVDINDLAREISSMYHVTVKPLSPILLPESLRLPGDPPAAESLGEFMMQYLAGTIEPTAVVVGITRAMYEKTPQNNR